VSLEYLIFAFTLVDSAVHFPHDARAMFFLKLELDYIIFLLKLFVFRLKCKLPTPAWQTKLTGIVSSFSSQCLRRSDLISVLWLS
jgi:hypothetical protein